MSGARPRHRLGWAVAVALLVGTTGCGEDPRPVAAPVPIPAADPQPFPVAEGRVLGSLEESLPEGPTLEPGVAVLEPGPNRLTFGLSDGAGQRLPGAEVGVYLARPDGRGLAGPVRTRTERLGGGRSIYVADVAFPDAGEWKLVAVARLDGRLVRTAPTSVRVRSHRDGPPRVGDRAPSAEVPARASASGRPVTVSLATEAADDVIGRGPLVLVFDPSDGCAGRGCDSVAEAAKAVAARERLRLVVVDGEPSARRAARRARRRYRVTSRGWLFVIDGDGVVRDRFEGPVSERELRDAVAAVG